MTGAAGAVVELPPTRANTGSPEHMAAVMATLPVKVQVGMLKAAIEGEPPRAVVTAATAATGSAGVAGLEPPGVPSGATSSAGPGKGG